MGPTKVVRVFAQPTPEKGVVVRTKVADKVYAVFGVDDLTLLEAATQDGGTALGELVVNLGMAVLCSMFPGVPQRPQAVARAIATWAGQDVDAELASMRAEAEAEEARTVAEAAGVTPEDAEREAEAVRALAEERARLIREREEKFMLDGLAEVVRQEHPEKE